TALGGLESLTLSGNGEATVTNVDGTKLVTVDASALNSVDADGAAAAGLSYTSGTTTVETISLGAGNDVIELNASTYDATDTITGFNAEADTLNVGAAGTSFEIYESTASDLDILLKEAAESTTAGDNLVFQFGGDSYVFIDGGDTELIEG